ncbi:ArsA family ATPase [Alicyclobacillus sp. SO9]|uniref:ArsA family ATPase n=1 Tax=Alicyclobacillus sp. SO9 TaxID=2665646 RepID=UPI0018E79F76|nr:TRC40/GET3/ArsA family transport-energizing ATPase [Alicyclobacillus sp. SO9]QQE77537.1 TRC40/GET3/ArsA family transport-energizing ATPase [Alicyclobacillus sp. SO9]
MTQTRVLIISGKGGVGKTTVAAATASAAAQAGQNTLVVSLDRAHNLGDVLQVTLGSSVTSVQESPNLKAMEIDPQAELSRNWGVLQQYINRFFRYLGVNGQSAEELAVFPGLEELLVLTRLYDLAESGDYDLIVADMAPTASSLRYLSFPDMMDGVLGGLVKWDRRIASLMRPLQGKYLKVPVPEQEVYNKLYDLAARLKNLRNLLFDVNRTAVRLVMIPETIVLEETRRALSYMNLFGMAVDAVVVNRIFPEEALNGYFETWGKIQSSVLQQAEESFAGLPILKMSFQESEVIGVPRLLSTADELYGTSNPADFLQARQPFKYLEADGQTVLSVHLGQVNPSHVKLQRREGDLIITVDGWRRVVTLPDSLVACSVQKASFKAGVLVVFFSETEFSGNESNIANGDGKDRDKKTMVDKREQLVRANAKERRKRT